MWENTQQSLMPGTKTDEDTLLQASTSLAELYSAENPFQGLFFIHLIIDLNWS